MKMDMDFDEPTPRPKAAPALTATLRDSPRFVQQVALGLSLLAPFTWLIIALLELTGWLAPGSMVTTGIAALIAVSVTMSSYWLIHRNRVRFGMRVLFYGLVVIIGGHAAFYGGFVGPSVVGLIIPVILAGLLSRGIDAVRVAGLVFVVYLAMVIAQLVFGYRPVPVDLIYYVVVFIIVTAFLAALGWYSGRSIEQIVIESEARAEELLRRTEQIMEKNIQQVELGSELAASAAQMQMTSQQQASGASEQASAVSEVSTTIEELGSTARQIALSADHVTGAAQQTLENLSLGQGSVDESIQAMERIRARMQDVSTRVLSLGERSQQIGEIIDLIDDISDETHLLALNAAIEAAGAGEHGRRFAVVAAEVKSLANRTLAAAREVKGVIAEIRQATNAAVLAAEEGSKEVELGVDLAHRAGQVMDNIVMVAERTAQAASEIGLATAQQQSASEQVVETMREIAEVARQSAASARQTADSSATLTAIASRLHGYME